MKKQILLLLVFLLMGCGKPEVSPEPTGANTDLSAAEKTDDTNESVVETDRLTAALEGVVPDEYKEKEELFFQTAAASSELGQSDPSVYNGAACAVDGDIATSWKEGAPGNGTGETINVGFSGPQVINYLEFHVGDWQDETQWEQNSRPGKLEIVVNGETVDVELQNVRACQYVVFSEPVETDSFALKITDVYPGAGEIEDTGISEIRAYGDVITANERTISNTQPQKAVQAEEANADSANAADQNADTCAPGYNTYGNPDWFESRPYWEQDDGSCFCTVSGTTGDDLTVEFSDGVSLPGYCCSYEVQTDGTIIYAYKKGWYFIYYPSEDALSVHCGANTDSVAVGYYHPTSGNRVSESDADSSEDHYSVTREHWENSERAALTIVQQLDGYGSLSFISESGKSAITFYDGGEGDSTYMFYTNISGETPDDVWDLTDGSVSDDSVTLYLQNSQGQRATVTADLSEGTIDFTGIIYRNTPTRYYY